MRTQRTAFTLTELLALLVTGTLLLSMTVMLFSCGGVDSAPVASTDHTADEADSRMDDAKNADDDQDSASAPNVERARPSAKDKSQLREIHKAFVTWANENRENLPTPGLVGRRPVQPRGQGDPLYIPGQGPEAEIKNHTRHLYSMMISGGYFKPDLLIGPTEVNPVVREHTDYNYDAYNPAAGTYWDGDFKAPPSGGEDPNVGGFFAAIDGESYGQVSHTSYSHMAIFGMRKRLKWRNAPRANIPILATRGTGGGPGGFGGAGPKTTSADDPEYTRSPTLQLHGPNDQWVGNVVYSDNSVRSTDTFYPDGVTYTPNQEGATEQPDNIFAAEFSDYGDDPRRSNDAWLGIFSRTTETVTVPIFDRLDESSNDR